MIILKHINSDLVIQPGDWVAHVEQHPQGLSYSYNQPYMKWFTEEPRRSWLVCKPNNGNVWNERLLEQYLGEEFKLLDETETLDSKFKLTNVHYSELEFDLV